MKRKLLKILALSCLAMGLTWQGSSTPAAQRTPAGSGSGKEAPWNLKEPFSHAEVISTEESPEDFDGNFNRLKVIRTSFKYPLIRVQEKLNRNAAGEVIVLRKDMMVADHVMVQAEAGVTEAELTAIVSKAGGTIRSAVAFSDFYLIGFNGENVHALDRIIAALKAEKKITVAEPDYILRSHP